MQADNDFIVCFQAGKAAAYETIFKQHHRAVFNFVLGIVKDSESAEEITADTFVKLWERKETFQTADSIKAFLFITARNASYNFCRDHKKQLAAHHKLTEQFSDISYTPDEWGSRHEVPRVVQMAEMIKDTLSNLPPKQREVMEMIIFEGLTDEEVATRLNKNFRTVQNLKSIAVSYLRGKLEDKPLTPAIVVLIIFSLTTLF